MASLTYVCFVPAKGLIRDLSANWSNIAFAIPLASKWWWQSGLISHNIQFVNGILCNCHFSLCAVVEVKVLRGVVTYLCVTWRRKAKNLLHFLRSSTQRLCTSSTNTITQRRPVKYATEIKSIIAKRGDYYTRVKFFMSCGLSSWHSSPVSVAWNI